MAKTNNNPLLTGVSGKIGNLLIKQTKYGTVITQMPERVKKKPTARQKIHRDIFAAAIKYARAAKIAHIRVYHNEGRADSQEIYLAAIKDYVAAAHKAFGLPSFEMDETNTTEQQKVFERINRKTTPEPTSENATPSKMPTKRQKKAS